MSSYQGQFLGQSNVTKDIRLKKPLHLDEQYQYKPLQPSTGAQQPYSPDDLKKRLADINSKIPPHLLEQYRYKLLRPTTVAQQPVKVSTGVPSDTLDSIDVPPKPVNILPVAAAAAIGIYAMTR